METKIWIVFFALFFIILLMAYKIFKKKKKSKIMAIVFVILLVFFLYSFFTVNGSVRLSIALYGHPDIAYTTKFEDNYYSNSSKFKGKRKYIIPTKHIYSLSSYFECRYYGPIKITVYYGFA